MHTLKNNTQQVNSTLAKLQHTLNSDYMFTLTKHYILVEAHVLVHMMYHGKHMDTEKQRYTFHFVG